MQKVFHLNVFVDPVFGAFAPDAGLLHAAEGRNFGRNNSFVDAHDSAFECFCHAPYARRVRECKNTPPARTPCRWPSRITPPSSEEKRIKQAPPARTSLPSRHQLHPTHAGENRRLEESSAQRMPFSTGVDFPSVFDGIFNVFFHLFDSLVVDERPDRYAAVHSVSNDLGRFITAFPNSQ